MARIGTAPAAARYAGIEAGPRLAYLWETQEGYPVDGTNSLLRQLSPFTFRFVVPEALLAAGVVASTETIKTTATVNAITAASLEFDYTDASNSAAQVLSRSTVVGSLSQAQVQRLQAFVSEGAFLTTQEPGFHTTIANALTAADIALQVKALLDAPPLTLLVNPIDFTLQHTKIQSYQSRTRFGYVFESWGEEQPTMSISGTTAGFVAATGGNTQASITGQTSSVSGYQACARLDSAAWQNFMSLFQFYRSNGYIFDRVGGTEAHLFAGSVAIDYDQWTYVGNIDSMSFAFEEGTPLRVQFDMEFVVNRMYDCFQRTSTVLPQTRPSSTTEVGQTVFELLGGS